jgi:hypothetical protein
VPRYGVRPPASGYLYAAEIGKLKISDSFIVKNKQTNRKKKH